MRIYSIRKALNIPEYKITEVISEDNREIHLRIEPYKKKGFLCSGCREIHKKGNHWKEESIVEDLPILGKRIYLNVVKRRYVCPKDKRTHLEEDTYQAKCV